MHLSERDSEAGFTMIVTVIGMSIIALLVLVAVTAVNGDSQLTSRDLARKQAYEAAKAGIDEYAFHLHIETAYWSKCLGVASESPVNQKGETTNRRKVPGMPGAEYALELIPANNFKKCDSSSLAAATETMLQANDPLKGTFQIRSNGYAGGSQVRIMATFKPSTFLNYVYFTQYETSDPSSYATPELRYGAEQQCGKLISEHRTETPLKNKAGEVMNEQGGVYNPNAFPRQSKKYCEVISFVSADNIKGPMHTNDAFVFCGSPTLGRNSNDPVEVGEKNPGWFQTSESFLHSAGEPCSGSNKNVKGLFLLLQPKIEPPATNKELETIADPEYVFTGETSICLNGNSMSVGKGKSCSEKTMPLPANGVVYVAGPKCGETYTPYNVSYSSTEVSSCGTVNLKGTYSKPLTIAASNDILITDDLTKTNETAVLGLIANRFIRIYHPVNLNTDSQGNVSCSGNDESKVGTIKNLKIEAALLAIEHSFIVDNFNCGGSLGKLNVTGAIAQKFRGAVGTTGGNGFTKEYQYDERLRTIEPPSFLQPIKSDWVIGRETTE